jgi:hypothetical protein
LRDNLRVLFGLIVKKHVRLLRSFHGPHYILF